MPNFQACKAAIEQARDSNSLYAAFQLLHTSLMNDANCKCTKEDVVKVCTIKYNAVGKRFYSLPMSPPKVLEKISD